MILRGRAIANGIASGEALISSDVISFLGGVDAKTGVVVEKGHALEGKCIAGKVLIFPHGKGSTVGSYVLYQLAKNKVAPVAIVNEKAEIIVAVGAIVAEIPMVDMVETGMEGFKDGDLLEVDGTNGRVEKTG